MELEAIGPDAPAGLTWTASDRLDVVAAAPIALRGAIERAIRRRRDGLGPLDPPWTQPGWFARASAWMTDRMAALERPATSPRLDALGPADTLVHGDFHPWNVADEPVGPRVFDWTDAAVSHPFTDLAVYATRPDDVAHRRAMRDAYLARWADQLEPPELARAGDLAILVGTRYQVDSYLRIVESLAPDDLWDLGMATGSWARAAVEAMRDGIALVRPGRADG